MFQYLFTDLNKTLDTDMTEMRHTKSHTRHHYVTSSKPFWKSHIRKPEQSDSLIPNEWRTQWSPSSLKRRKTAFVQSKQRPPYPVYQQDHVVWRQSWDKHTVHVDKWFQLCRAKHKSRQKPTANRGEAKWRKRFCRDRVCESWALKVRDRAVPSVRAWRPPT